MASAEISTMAADESAADESAEDVSTEDESAEGEFAQLKGAVRISLSPHPKIQRVPRHLRGRELFAEYYWPSFVSFGPIHHGEPNLQLGEKYKLTWTQGYLRDTATSAQRLHRTIRGKIITLKKLYTEDAIQQFDDEKLAWMLFVDGCSLLQILKNLELPKPKALNLKVDHLVLVCQDMLLLENQLPFELLSLLSGNDNATLLEAMNVFLINKGAFNGTPDLETLPPHLLDQFRRNVLSTAPQEIIVPEETTYRNIQELKATGIKVRESTSSSPLNISFSSSLFNAELRIPKIVVDHTTASTYLNLMAYEACPDFENNYEISSYVEFLDSLIDHPEDVKELRAAKILHNGLGSDEEVAKLFNIISTDVVPNIQIYGYVRTEIEKHYKKKHRTWFAQAYHIYFSNPWAIVAFIAASLALVLTFIQTWFAIFPKSK